MRQHKILKIRRRALIVAIPQPEKALEDPGAIVPYLCCASLKIFERLTYTRVEPTINQLLPREQAGFRHGRSAVDQVILFTQDIKDSFSGKISRGCVCRPDSSLRHCMASWSHLQAAAIATWTYGPDDHGHVWQWQLYPYHWKW